MASSPQSPNSPSTENENPPKNPSKSPSIENLPENPRSPTPSCWSELPKDVLQRIADLAVDSDADRSRIRGICKSWRSLLPEDQLPRLIPEVIPPLRPGLSIHRSQIHLFYPIPPAGDDRRGLEGRWLVRSMVRSRDDPNTHSLCCPLKRTHRYFDSEPTVKGELSLLSCRSLELASVFHITTSDDCDKEVSDMVVGGWFNSDSGTRKFALLANLKNGSLHFWKLGDERWTRIKGTWPDSIAFDNGKFFVFEADGWRLKVFHHSLDPTLSKYIPGPDILEPDSTPGELHYCVEVDGSKYLVGSETLVCCAGSLYLAIEGSVPLFKPSTLFVFLLNEEDGVWKRVHFFGDRILFIFSDVCFVLPNSSINLPQWEPSTVCLATWNMGILRYHEYIKGHRSLPDFAKSLNLFSCLEYVRYFRAYLGNTEELAFPFFIPPPSFPEKLPFRLFFPPPSWLEWGYRSRNDIKVRVRLDLMHFAKSASRFVVLSDSEEEDDEEGEEDGGGGGDKGEEH